MNSFHFYFHTFFIHPESLLVKVLIAKEFIFKPCRSLTELAVFERLMKVFETQNVISLPLKYIEKYYFSFSDVTNILF